MPVQNQPNVVLIMTDQHRKSAVGCYGNELIDTPAIDSLAADGARFDTCYVQSPICSPSRATIFTGLYPHIHGLWANGVSLPERHSLLTRELASAGYACGMVGKQHLSASHGRTEKRYDDGYEYFEWAHDPIHQSPDNGYHRWLQDTHPQRWDELRESGRWQHPEAGDSAKGPLLFDTVSPAEHYSHWVGEKSIEFLKGRDPDRPFMLVANFFDPHHPFGAPEEYLRRYDPERMPMPIGTDTSRADKPALLDMLSRQSYAGTAPGFQDYTESELRETIAAYYAMVTLVDHEIGRIMATLEDLGVADNTLVIFTSDHGEMLGDHGVMLKGPMQYEAAVNVSLIMRWPDRIPAGTVVDSIVQSIDIPATIMHAAGLSDGPWRQGRSLLPAADGSGPADRRWALCQYRNSGHPYESPIFTTMLRYGDHKLVMWLGEPATDRPDDGELYDLAHDPDELVNRYHDPAYEELRHTMMTKLIDVLAATEDRSRLREADW